MLKGTNILLRGPKFNFYRLKKFSVISIFLGKQILKFFIFICSLSLSLSLLGSLWPYDHPNFNVKAPLVCVIDTTLQTVSQNKNLIPSFICVYILFFILLIFDVFISVDSTCIYQWLA